MRRLRGFTMIEMLIALVLLTLIMASTVAAMRTFGNTGATVEQLTDRVEEIRAVSDFLRRSIGDAAPVLRAPEAAAGFIDDDRGGVFFVGDDSHLTWVAPLVAGAGHGGMHTLELRVADEVLQLRWQPYHPDGTLGDWPEAGTRTLVDQVEELRIDYLGDYGQPWEESWPGAETQPVAVRINLRAAGRYWPELIIRASGAGLHQWGEADSGSPRGIWSSGALNR